MLAAVTKNASWLLGSPEMRLPFVQGFGALRYAAPKLLSDREAGLESWRESGSLDLQSYFFSTELTMLTTFDMFVIVCLLWIPEQDQPYRQF